MSDTRLELGAQSRAAKLVLDSLTGTGDTLSQLGHTLEGSMEGFRGEAAGGFAEAVDEWFKAAGSIPRVLAEFATKLVETDKSEGQTDSVQQSIYAKRLGGMP